MTAHTYDPTGVAAPELSKAVETALPGKAFVLRVAAEAVFDFTDALDAADVTTLDAAVASHAATVPARALATAKASKTSAIDSNTGACILAGYTHGGVLFSLSPTAQKNLSEIRENKDALGYPFQMASADNTVVYSIADAAEIEVMYQIALGTIITHYNAGNVLKAAALAATTVADVDAITDDR